MQYKCTVCDWIYEEEKEGKLFEDLCEDWLCPICGATKDMFVKLN